MSGREATVHAMRAMLARDISPRDVLAAITDADQRFPTYAGSDGRPRVMHQWRDIAIVTVGDDPVQTVVTVLYRREDQWVSTDGRPSGRCISRGTRRRMQALLRRAAEDGSDVVAIEGEAA